MARLIPFALLLTALSSFAPAAQAQSFYNPYRTQYNNWNNQFRGYGGGSREYRQQIREMNPYRNDYNQYRRQNSGYYGY